MMEKKTCTVPEMAQIVGISKTMAYELARTKGFPAFRVRNRILISRAGLERWIEEQAGKGV